MKKTFIRYTSIISIVFVIFNVLVFVVPFSNKNNVAFWIAYAFGDLAIISQIGFSILAFKGKTSFRSMLYGLPIIKLGYIYFAVQLCFSILTFIINCFVVIPFWIILVVLVVFNGLFAIGLITTSAYREEIERQDENQPKQTSFISKLTDDCKNLVNMYEGSEYYSLLEKLYEEIRYSDPVSSENLVEIENELNEKFETLKNELENKANIDSTTNKMLVLIKNRNDKLKREKN